MLEYDLHVTDQTVVFRVHNLTYDPETVKVFYASNSTEVYYGFDAEIWSNYVVLPDTLYKAGSQYRPPRLECERTCGSVRAAKCMRTRLDNALKEHGGKNIYNATLSDFWDK